MVEFLASVLIFVAAHTILPIPAIRNRLIRLLGRSRYLLVYSLLSTALLIWIIVAARRAPFVPLWPVQDWQVWPPIILGPIAAWLLAAGLIEPNPLSISIRREAHEVGPVPQITRHPILWSFLLWAWSHIPANGDLVSLIMFGGFGLLALAGFWLVDSRARQRMGIDRWEELARVTSIIPFAAAAAGRARVGWSLSMTLATVIAGGLAAWFATGGHLMLTGVDPLSRFGW